MTDIIEWIVGWFVESSLYDIDIDDAELCESAQYDSMAEHGARIENDVPIGKQVR